jgi:hypothetical protein
MNNNESNKEGEFFVRGAKTYLDVDDAMAEFRRQVQDQCTKVVSGRLDEIMRAAEMDWTPNHLKDYNERSPDRLYLGKQVWVENFGGLYFCLTLSRENDRAVYGALVYLYRQRKSLAVHLWASLSRVASATAYVRGNNLFFLRHLSEEKLQDFREYLNLAIDDFVAFIRDSGGLKRHLVQESQLSEPGSGPGGTAQP